MTTTSHIPPLETATGPTGTVTVQTHDGAREVTLLRGKAMAWPEDMAWAAGRDAEWLSAEFKRRGWRATFRGNQ